VIYEVKMVSNILLDLGVDEKMRMKLLQEEQKMRSKQPEAWTKTKFRKYANFGRNRAKDEVEITSIKN
jgi:hypothetical protein